MGGSPYLLVLLKVAPLSTKAFLTYKLPTSTATYRG